MPIAIKLGWPIFRRKKFEKIFFKFFPVTLNQGISAGKILIEYIDNKCELGAVFADLIQLRSIENAPFWLVTATGKIMGRCLARPNAVLVLVNGVLISDRVKLRHEVVVSLGEFLTKIFD